MADCQSLYLWLTHRYRGQAPSHTCIAGVLWNLVLHHFLKREAPQRVLQKVAHILA
jgi:hypothetical protein